MICGHIEAELPKGAGEHCDEAGLASVNLQQRRFRRGKVVQFSLPPTSAECRAMR
jgi:hypothetical protein